MIFLFSNGILKRCPFVFKEKRGRKEKEASKKEKERKKEKRFTNE